MANQIYEKALLRWGEWGVDRALKGLEELTSIRAFMQERECAWRMVRGGPYLDCPAPAHKESGHSFCHPRNGLYALLAPLPLEVPHDLQNFQRGITVRVIAA